MKKLAGTLLFVSSLLLIVVAQGCNTYSYFDVEMKLGTAYNTVAIGRINSCHVFVTGGSADDFTLPYANCHTIDPGTRNVGKFQYATFADSGSAVTFTLHLFEKVESAECELGTGSTTLTVEGGKTVAGSLTVDTLKAGCP
jgi:hypothetical protein